jgi:uncharacterized protein YukE
MSLIKVNINNLSDISKEIMDLSYKYNDLVDRFYQRVNGINGKTNEWRGLDAQRFIDTINKEKIIYETISKTFKDYSIKLDEYNKKIEELIKLNSII